MTELIVYKINTASVLQIEEHFNLCSDDFINKLSGKVNIKSYSFKIKENALTFEAWCNEKLVGLVACYANNIETNIAFITNVSVIKVFQSKGIAKKLLESLKYNEQIKKFRKVQLKVDIINNIAINLYKIVGFDLDCKLDKQLLMTYYTKETNPLVSICCITFNHDLYIRQCIDGFLIQKTTFPIEILIHDDASTDKTADIIREYEEKYPNIIKPIYQIENQYSKNVSINRVYQYSRAKGKYIALCEGDDYWIDPLKLQKQVDFLEENQEYGMCHTNFSLVEGKRFSKVIKKDDDNYLTDILEGNYQIGTLTVLFRKSIYNSIPKYYSNKDFLMGDLPLWIEIASVSKIKYLDDITAKYRVLANSASHSLNIEKELQFYKSSFDCRTFYKEAFNVDIKLSYKDVYIVGMKSAFKKKDKIIGKKIYNEAKENDSLSFKLLVFYWGTISIFARLMINLLYKIA